MLFCTSRREALTTSAIRMRLDTTATTSSSRMNGVNASMLASWQDHWIGGVATSGAVGAKEIIHCSLCPLAAFDQKSTLYFSMQCSTAAGWSSTVAISHSDVELEVYHGISAHAESN